LGGECAAAKLYGIRGVPRVIVLDEDNRIVATGLRGKEFQKKANCKGNMGSREKVGGAVLTCYLRE